MSDIKLGSFPVSGAPPSAPVRVHTPEEALKIILPKVAEVRVAIKDPHLSPASLHKQLDLAIEELNAQMAKTGRALGFSYDKAAAQSVITVTNKDTGEVLRQIPGDAVLSVAHSIESLKGILYSNVM